MDTSPKREIHPAEGQSGKSTSPTESRHHGWWSGIYDPHHSSVQEMHERAHQSHTQKQQPSTTPRESRDISNKVDIEEWGRYRRKKSFLTELGGTNEN